MEYTHEASTKAANMLFGVWGNSPHPLIVCSIPAAWKAEVAVIQNWVTHKSGWSTGTLALCFKWSKIIFKFFKISLTVDTNDLQGQWQQFIILGFQERQWIWIWLKGNNFCKFQNNSNCAFKNPQPFTLMNTEKEPPDQYQVKEGS